MLSNEILALHHQSVVVDGHADTFGKLLNTPVDFFKRTFKIPAKFLKHQPPHSEGAGAEPLHIDYPRLKQGGTDLQVVAIYTPPVYHSAKATTFALRVIAKIHRTINESRGKIIPVLSKNDLKFIPNKNSFVRVGTNFIRASNPVGFLLSIEGGAPLDNRLDFLEIFYALGIRALGLTHNPHNELGDGIGVSRPKGLTGFGKDVVKKLDRMGMLIDVAHLAEPGFRDVARLAGGPIISSHTGVRALRNIPRNLNDAQIKEIVRRQGVMGIFYLPQYLVDLKNKKSGAVGVKNVVDHIQYIADKFGVDYVGLGSDFDGYSGVTEGLEDVSKLPNLTMELTRRGFTRPEIKKILGENFLRVFRTILH
ncbi:MAG: dipeptidase [Planctomycetota bacterium]